MTVIYRFIFSVLFFSLIVHSQFFPRPLILDDKVMALLESNGNAINRESDANNDQSDEDYRQTSYNNFIEFIQQLKMCIRDRSCTMRMY